MSSEKTLSTRQLARLLSIVTSDERGTKEAHRTALELIHQVPEAQTMWEELTSHRSGMPASLDLAKMMLTLHHDIRYPREGQEVVRWLAQQIPEAAAAWDRLEQLVRITGSTGALRLCYAIRSYTEYQALVRYESSWNDPRDLLDPAHDLGIMGKGILNLLDFNIFHETDAAKREVLERVRHRVEKVDSSRARPAFELDQPLAPETGTYPGAYNLGVLLSDMDDDEAESSSIYLARWLIRQVPGATEMWRSLHQPGELGFTPFELTKMVLAARDAVTFPEAEPTVETLARTAPGAMEAWAELQRLRQDVGGTKLYGDQIADALSTLDQLLKGKEPGLKCWSVQAVMLLLHEQLVAAKDPETRKRLEDVNARILQRRRTR